MTERQPGNDVRRDPTADPLDHPADPGAYVGREPERQAETIPGGVRSDDERIAANSTQRREAGRESVDATPSGHREGRPADDDLVREGGENR
jgi:hypothetical protein